MSKLDFSTEPQPIKAPEDKEIGLVEIGITYTDEGTPDIYEYSWHGGDLCSLTFDLLEESYPDKIKWDRGRGFKGMILGDLIQIGPYILDVLSIDFEQAIVRCRRARAKEK